LAKRSVEEYVRTRKFPETPADLDEVMSAKAGVFVSLKKHGELRGCIGTFLPQQENVAREVIQNAVSAATRDPRFQEVKESELDKIDYSVDVLSTPEPVNTLDELDSQRFGVIVSHGHHRGLLLPDLEGVDTVEQQLGIAMMKAGIDPGEEVAIERFEVKRYR
jgi:AmmeMemoRadiSam system protein A